MGFFGPQEILTILGDKAKEKAEFSIIKLLLLSILGGSFIAFGYLGYVRTIGTLPSEWGSFASFLGACVFPIGLVGIVLVGGELATGNMMTMFLGALQKKITISQMLLNWLIVLVGNVIGGMLIAGAFGHIVGMTEGAFLQKTLAIAQAKINDPPMVALISGIGCNVFVCMAVWIATGAKDYPGKFISMWFPVMVFVIIGFQHVVANAFIIPAAIFSGATAITWIDFIKNLLVVFVGNVIGGALCIGLPCHLNYRARNAVVGAGAKSQATVQSINVS